MPLQLLSSQDIFLPSVITAECRRRAVTITGPRGTLKKSFKHANVHLKMLKKKRGSWIRVEVWHGNRNARALVRTIASHIKNLIIGVTKGYRYEMKFVYAHFPINVIISKDERTIEIRNFIGNRNSIVQTMLHGVKVVRPEAKDTIEIVGNNLEHVSQSAASIQQATQVRNKDVRKFLDGIYVSQKGYIDAEFELPKL